ncbi:NAD(P)/FAD-dependent oxidoreductase [Streptococcus cuniculipharyngis]|uniref:FAD-binding oxidoreductase n=1 Tax=Streptococcus cuniculipharyngis TaxID=1562651 RepID=A0A5C5SDH0_9STRE|nr:FAD-dependent oxidoreductase [Streptococcus cuniculipharyngis]TWS98013.1 FAD-binding oxidoreductase [Streptococcus cuniculipharyngis]
MTRIAIIGAGIVGSTAAYYLSKYPAYQVTVFDHGLGQATKAAAGIISPWFSKRRHKAWYRLARLGADFYPSLVADLAAAGRETSFYQQTGVYLLKKNEAKLAELYQLAQSRRQESPLIGQLSLHSQSQVTERFPQLAGFEEALYASGGARVEGAELTRTLLDASGASLVTERVDLQVGETTYVVGGQPFDQVILACGAWLGQLLNPLGYEVDVKPQKGQLQDYFFDHLATETYPVVMPEGELDIIPFAQGKISVGASHENDRGFDLSLDSAILAKLETEALSYYPLLTAAKSKAQRVGIRAYTSDFSPFFGQVPHLPGVYAVSGLGSSGLTTGPLLAKNLVDLLVTGECLLPVTDYPIDRYIVKR